MYTATRFVLRTSEIALHSSAVPKFRGHPSRCSPQGVDGCPPYMRAPSRGDRILAPGPVFDLTVYAEAGKPRSGETRGMAKNISEPRAQRVGGRDGGSNHHGCPYRQLLPETPAVSLGGFATSGSICLFSPPQGCAALRLTLGYCSFAPRCAALTKSSAIASR